MSFPPLVDLIADSAVKMGPLERRDLVVFLIESLESDGHIDPSAAFDAVRALGRPKAQIEIPDLSEPWPTCPPISPSPSKSPVTNRESRRKPRWSTIAPLLVILALALFGWLAR